MKSVIRMLTSFILRKNYKIPKKTKVGKNVYLGSVRIDHYLDGALISIDDEAMLTDGVVILSHDSSSARRIGLSYCDQVRIGKRAFIGQRSIILPGVSIGDDAIVGAGSVVTKDVEPGVIVAGVPAQRIGYTKELDEKRLKLTDNMIDPGDEPFNLPDQSFIEIERMIKKGPIMVVRDRNRLLKHKKDV